MKVAFLARYTEGGGASSRVRVFQYLAPLQALGVESRVLVQWPPPSRAARAAYVAKATRLATWADVLVVQKPNQPAWMIDLLARINRHLIIDFDDAIWSPTRATSDPATLASFRGLEDRLLHACRRAGFVTTASTYLRDWIQERCPDASVTLIPEAIDLDAYSRVKEARPDRPVVVGWSGSPGNVKDLLPILPVLREISDGRSAVMRIISGRPPTLDGASFEHVPWTRETELDGLLGLDIGIMPFRDDARSWGRCGFKAIQYMGAGLPVVASPIGGGPDVVRDGVTGYLADGPGAWAARLRELIDDVDARRAMGSAGRRAAETTFSVQANVPKLVRLYEERCRARTPGRSRSGVVASTANDPS